MKLIHTYRPTNDPNPIHHLIDQAHPDSTLCGWHVVTGWARVGAPGPKGRSCASCVEAAKLAVR